MSSTIAPQGAPLTPATPSLGRRARTLFHHNRWWLARVLALPLHLFVFAIVVFFVVRLVPGDPAIALTGGQATEQQLADIRDSLGLSGPLWQQLVTYLGRLLTLDLGTSISTGQPVFIDIGLRLPQTLELGFMGLGLAAVIATLLSAVAAFAPTTPMAAIARGYSRAAGALPDFCLGIASILVFYVLLRVAPAPLGRLGAREGTAPVVTGLPTVDILLTGNTALIASAISHLVLPVGAMALAYAPYLMKQLIPALRQEIEAAPTRFRVASGAPRSVMVLSVFRRALPSAVVVTGSLLGGLLGGAVVMESMFGLGGIGQYAVAAVESSDYPAMQGVLIAMVAVVLVIFLIVDIVTMMLDPRRRVGGPA